MSRTDNNFERSVTEVLMDTNNTLEPFGIKLIVLATDGKGYRLDLEIGGENVMVLSERNSIRGIISYLTAISVGFCLGQNTIRS